MPVHVGTRAQGSKNSGEDDGRDDNYHEYLKLVCVGAMMDYFRIPQKQERPLEMLMMHSVLTLRERYDVSEVQRYECSVSNL